MKVKDLLVILQDCNPEAIVMSQGEFITSIAESTEDNIVELNSYDADLRE